MDLKYVKIIENKLFYRSQEGACALLVCKPLSAQIARPPHCAHRISLHTQNQQVQ